MTEKIIFFDGICIFCDSFINFVVKRDKKKIFKLCYLQSNKASQLASKYDFSTEHKNLSSIIFLKNGKVFRKSSAIIEILKEFKGLWKLASLLLIIPKKFRDFFYDYFGKNRYRWFGKKNSCKNFSEEIRKRFLQ